MIDRILDARHLSEVRHRFRAAIADALDEVPEGLVLPGDARRVDR